MGKILVFQLYSCLHHFIPAIYPLQMTREALKPEGGTKEDVGLLGTMFAGGMAGVTLWSVIFPADVIKSRLQVSESVSEADWR